MAGLFNNLSNYLQKVDSLLGEQLEEPGHTATAIRSQRRALAGGDETSKLSEDGSQLSNAESTSLTPTTPVGSGASGVVTDDANRESAPHSSEHPRTVHVAQDLLLNKDQEIEALNQELLEYEDRCKSLQAEVADTWKTYKSAQEKAAIREGELHDEINSVKRAKEADKQQYRIGIDAQSSEIQALKDTISTMSQEEDRMHARIASLQQELLLTREDSQGMRNELLQTREAEGLSIVSVREELRQSQQQVEELRSQHATWQRNAQKRQVELEQLNAELSASLAKQSREMELLIATPQENHEVTVLTARYDALHVENTQLQAQFNTESQEKHAITRQLLATEGELTRLRTTHEAETRGLLATNRDLSTKLQAQESRISELEAASAKPDHPQEFAELQRKLHSSTEQLLRKQSALSDLQTERSALRAKIQDLERRCQNLEQQLDQCKDAEDDSMIMRNSKDKLTRRRGFSRRNDGIGKALEPIGMNPQVVKAVEAVDSWSLLAGSFMRANPFARFGFLLYLIVLHIWVFVVLSFQTSALQDSINDLPANNANINPN